MGPVSHSYWPASSAKRNMTCLGSFQATKPWHDAPRTSSVFAAEGTCAHTLAEEYLTKRVPMDNAIDQTLTVDGHQILVTETMVDFVELYVVVVEGLRALGYQIWFEQRVSPEWIWTMSGEKPPVELFGTADCIAFNPDTGHLVIVDLKFGVGVPVDIDWNPQLLYYATGALDLKELRNRQIKTIETVIVQPRAPHADGPVRRKVYTWEEFKDWGLNEFKPAVEISVNGKNPPLKAGEHCRWCPAKLSCIELEKTRNDDARRAFTDNPDPDWAQLLDDAIAMEAWVNEVRTQAHLAAERGVVIPGWKLVPKRAVTSWSNPDSVLALLRDAGIPDTDILEPAALRSPFQIKSLRAVKRDPALLKEVEDLTSKNSSGTTIARDSDPRKAVDPRLSAREAFMDLPDE